MGEKKRHHVVSRGLQRHFAAGEQILLVDKVTRTAKSVGTADAFLEPRFNSVLTDAGWDQTLENEWARVEGLALPAARRLATGDEKPDDRHFVKVVVAIHIARSLTFRDWQHEIVQQVALDLGLKMEADETATHLFERSYNRPPEPGEIRALIDRAMDQAGKTQGLRAERMAHFYTKSLEYVENCTVQLLYTIGQMEWVIGDTPVVLANNDLTRLHALKQLAVFEASVIYMPIGRRVAITFHGDECPPDQHVPVSGCQRINGIMWRNCQRFLACHPAADPGRLLATTIARDTQAA